jgi:hypothetical protein
MNQVVKKITNVKIHSFHNKSSNKSRVETIMYW